MSLASSRVTAQVLTSGLLTVETVKHLVKEDIDTIGQAIADGEVSVPRTEQWAVWQHFKG